MQKIKELKALSICQPWAECIVSKGKNVENRSWDTRYRGFFAIHASKAYNPKRFGYLKDYRIKLERDDVSYGAIVGFAELVETISDDEVTRGTQRWFQGDVGFVLKNVIRLKKPIPVKGALSFWKLSGRELKAALNQLSAAQKKKISKNPLQKK